MKQGRILVIRGGAIGDFILTLPVLAALRRQFPHTHLELLGYPHIAQLARAGGLVDGVRAIEAQALAGFFAAGGVLDAGMCAYFAGFDLILSYLFDPDHIFQTNVAASTRAQFIQGPHRPDETQPIHAAEVFLKPLERLAVFGADAVPRLALSPAPPPGSVLALHPGSGGERKNWPEAQWADLLAGLVEQTDWPLLLVGSEAEGDRLERLARALPADRCTVARSRPLVELAALLQGCRGFVGHDSGITHLAAALGKPCVVLWAETALTVWEPRGSSVVVLQEQGGLAALSVGRVMDAVQRLAD